MNKDIVKVDQSELIRVVREAAESGGETRITVVGNSMYPFLRNGIDSVVLTAAGDIRPCDVLFYLRGDGHCVLHRCIKIKNGEYVMCGDNQTELEYGIKKENIIAAARVFYRGDRKITDKTAWYRLYKLLWCTLFPMRPFMCALLKGVMRVKRIFK